MKFKSKTLKVQEHFKILKYQKLYDRKRETFKINISYETSVYPTPRTLKVAEAFGLGAESRRLVLYDNVEFKVKPTDIVYITGDSGSGKSVLLRAMKKDLGDEAIDIDEVKVDPDKPIVETIGERFDEALELLSRVGLNDAYLFLRRYSELSEGQKYRYKLAKLMESGKQWWVMDEFCSTLDRDTAKIVAFNVQKQARRMGKAVIAATTHTDLLEDLAPSVHIHKGWGKKIEVKYYPNRINRECSIVREMRIEEGAYRDYKQLSDFHYRSKASPYPRKIFTLKRGSEVCGVIVYNHPPMNVKGRSLVWKGSFDKLRSELSTISRVIIHPKYRSVGLGQKIVRETLLLAGTPHVETVAVMARYNPFFEKAGMKRILVTKPDPKLKELMKRLEELGFNPALASSIEYNLKKLSESRKQTSTVLIEGLKKLRVHPKVLGIRSTSSLKRGELFEKLRSADDLTLAKVIRRLSILAQSKVYLFWSREDAG
ncbi:ATP-binding cassette domain-containing protein [Candidatus Bathyarchaeota archaeon]|nr:ATP-binding cassette domain-containing protein [Candidatus Bathyarchaeota archaeon]